MVDTSPLRVLVADGITDRVNGFRMTSNIHPKPSFLFRIVRNKEALAKSLYECQWDVLLHSIHLGRDCTDAMECLGMIADAHRRGSLRACLITSSVTSDGIKLVRALRNLGVPSRYYPYNYQNPSQHGELPIDAPLVVRKET